MYFYIVLSLREKLKDAEIGGAKAHDFKNVMVGTLRSLVHYPMPFLSIFIIFVLFGNF